MHGLPWSTVTSFNTRSSEQHEDNVVDWGVWPGCGDEGASIWSLALVYAKICDVWLFYSSEASCNVVKA